MRKFICYPFGEEVDLDDPKTYEHLPDNVIELRVLMMAEIGHYYYYVKFLHKHMFKGHHEQKTRVKKLIKTFVENEVDNRCNVMWYQEQVFLFRDEIENMC